MPEFSIIVVCLNAGDKLLETLESVRSQTFPDYEIVIKDGGSRDGSVDRAKELLAADLRVRFFEEQDTGIYEAMNQAVAHATGAFCIFLNCGDHFHDEKVLENMAAGMKKDDANVVYYGDRFLVTSGSVEHSPVKITPFVCYRNIPCHQTCFYSRDLFAEEGYRPKYKVRADYEHFLRCFFTKGTRFVHLQVVVADYEGGGYSDVHVAESAAEHREITGMYLSVFQRFYCRAFLILTLQPLRQAMARSRRFSGFYNGLVRLVRRG